MTSAYFKSLSTEEQARYRDKLSVHNGITLADPYDTRNKCYFVRDSSLWPCVSWPYLYSYLVETPGPYSRESLKAYKSLEAFNYYASGKIQNLLVYVNKEAPKVRVLLGSVLPGQRSADPYECWIVAEEDGAILSAHCQCMAGLGEVCSHVAGILFLVEAAVRDGKNRITATSKECVWRKAEKTVDPAPIINIDFSKPIRNRCSKVTTKRPIQKARGSPQKLFNLIMTNIPQAKILKHYPARSFDPEETESASEDEENKSLLPIPLTELHDPSYEALAGMDLDNLLISVFDSLQITKSEARYLEQVTRSQKKCEAWRQHRKGRLTASQFHRVLSMKDTTSPLCLVSEVVGYSESTSVASTTWGIKNEETARNHFINEMKGRHENFKCSEIGLVVNVKWPHLGASPDGFSECTCCGKAILEIKCPYSHRLSTLKQAVKDETFCLDKNGLLKKNHSYYTQVQGQLQVTEAPFCYFVVLLQDGINYQQIFPDNVFWEHVLKPRLDTFYILNVLPELLTRKRDRKNVESGKEPLYCLCKKPEEGKMIACDDDACKTVWFHFKCLGIKRKPSGKWFCPECKTQ